MRFGGLPGRLNVHCQVAARSLGFAATASRGGLVKAEPVRQLVRCLCNGAGAASASPPAQTQLVWRTAATAFGVLVVGSGACVAALPSIISTRWGLDLALSVLNSRYSPGRVEIAEVRAAWNRQLEVQCVKIYEAKSGGALLLHINTATSAEALWPFITGSHRNVVLTKPLLNTAYDPRYKDFKFIRWLEDAGILDPAAPLPPVTAPDSATGAAVSDSQSPDSRLASSKSSRPSSHPTSAAARRAHGPHLGKKVESADGDDKSRKSDEKQKQSPAAAAISAASEATPNLYVGADFSSPQAAAAKAAAERGEPQGRLEELLCTCNSVIGITADVSLPTWQITVADGRLMVADEMRQMVGDHVHLTAALGLQQVQVWAEEVKEDCSWVSQRRPQGAENAQPCCMQVHAEHLKMDAQAWSADKGFILHRPATTKLEFTPGLSRFGLSSINPLLSQAVGVRDAGSVEASFSPEKMIVPYDRAMVQVSPMRLDMGSTSLAFQLLAGLGLLGKGKRASAIESVFGLLGRGSGGAAPEAESATTVVAMRACVSSMDVGIVRGRTVHTQRADMLIGPPDNEQPVHICVFGGCNLETDAVDMTVGLPLETLKILGVDTDSLPEEYILPAARIQGTLDEPTLEVGDGLKRLAQLHLRQRMLKAEEKREKGGVGNGLISALRTLKHLVLRSAPASHALAQAEDDIYRDLQECPSAVPCPTLPPWQDDKESEGKQKKE